MLSGTEKALAQQIAEAVAVDEDQEEIKFLTEVWTKVFEKLFPHLVKNVQVNGIAPPNGGPIQHGVIS